ncbi:MAG: FecR domain-containing protein, partial [Planctomycetes bacterium]|nr:FecR domain-containing protein [Planctomycetota bacterium]
LDGSARRVEARWKSTPVAVESKIAAWLGAAVAAAAAILLVISALRSEPKAPADPVVRTAPPPPAPDPAPRPAPEPPVAPRVPAPAPVEPPRAEPHAPRQAEPRPEPPAPAEPRTPAPAPSPAPRPEPPKRTEPAPTQVTRAVALLREADGAFDLADKPLRGKQKDLTVGAGDRLRASTPVKITLADDRVVLLAPRTVLEFRPEEKRLTLAMEQGELLADLIGPGPEMRVVTKACDVTPLGTVFGVKVDAGRVTVTVEKGRVEVQSPRGRATLRPAESLQASEDGTLGTPGPADFRTMAWARSHRAPELSLYAEDFSKPGAWAGEIDKGVARAVAKAGGGPVLHLATEKPLFEVPVRGSMTVVCRSDRAGKFKIQFYSPELKTTYTKQNLTVLRSDAWRAVTVDFDDFAPSDKSRPARVTPGSGVTDLLLMYGDEGERGNFWVDSIKVTEVRP